jgi:hypothetical protein
LHFTVLSEDVMAEVLVKFTEPVRASDGRLYSAQACGRVADDGLWEGWVEFTAAAGSGVSRTGRETEQPNLADLTYWAQGLSMVYLEGALTRALATPAADAPPEFELRVDSGARVAGQRPALNPFLVYAEGEDFLRAQLLGLSREELATIVTRYSLPVNVDLQSAAPSAIVEDIARTLHDARRPNRAASSERRAS